jgi:hypothetical protein
MRHLVRPRAAGHRQAPPALVLAPQRGAALIFASCAHDTALVHGVACQFVTPPPPPAKHWYLLQPPFSFGFYLAPSQALCVLARQTLVELKDSGAFVEGGLPVFLIPARAVVDGTEV